MAAARGVFFLAFKSDYDSGLEMTIVIQLSCRISGTSHASKMTWYDIDNGHLVLQWALNQRI
jgi:hypothetical protein